MSRRWKFAMEWDKTGRVCKKRFIREERLPKRRRNIEENFLGWGEKNNVYSKMIWRFEQSQSQGRINSFSLIFNLFGTEDY